MASVSVGVGAPCKAAAPLKILGVSRVIWVGLSSDLYVALDPGLGDAVQGQHTAFAGAAPQARGERPVACRAEVFALQPAERFVRVRSPRPLQQLDAKDKVHVAKGLPGADVAVIVDTSPELSG